MPVMDGLEATRAIRRIEETSASNGNPRRRVRIIALTANTSSVDRERCIEAGMDGYFQKPFRPNDLLSTVARYLDDEVQPGPNTTALPASSEVTPPAELATPRWFNLRFQQAHLLNRAAAMLNWPAPSCFVLKNS